MGDRVQELIGVIQEIWPDWRVAEPLGSGAFSVVFRAARADRIAGEKDEAIKVIRIPKEDGDRERLLANGDTPEQADDYYRQIADASMHEIRTMGAVNGHTNIVNIHDYKVYYDEEKRVWYLLIRMELLDKVRPKEMSGEDVVRLGIDVCTALEICREHNIVHRDITLDNIFCHDGNYKLGDFGVARNLEGTVQQLTVAGTPDYMAPELYNDRMTDADIDSAAKVDIYSLGIVMYRLCHGMHYPFENAQGGVSPSEREAAKRKRLIEQAEIPAPAFAPEGLSRIILKACSPDPKDRYLSAAEMKEDLLNLARTAPQPRPGSGNGGKAGTKHRVWLPVVLLAAALVLAVLLFRNSGTVLPAPEETPEATAEPTREPTEAPSPELTEAPSPEPTDTPSPEPTEAPSPEPTDTPSPEPTEVPTQEPTEAPTPEPTDAPEAESWPVLELSGKRTYLTGSGLRPAYFGPGKQYMEAGAYDPGKNVQVTALFAEGDYILAEIRYLKLRQCVYFRASSLAGAFGEGKELTPYPAVVTEDTGSDALRFGPGEDYEPARYITMNTGAGVENKNSIRLAKGDRVSAFFETDGWVFAELVIPDTKNLVRVWIPASLIAAE